jgi:hypothetical protein
VAGPREHRKGDEGGAPFLERGAGSDRHPGVVAAVSHQGRDLEPRGLAQIVDGGPVDAEAYGGDPLSCPDKRGKGSPEHRGAVAGNLVIDDRAQVEHGRVEQHARHHRGERRVLEERGDDAAAHRLPGEHDVPGAVRERPSHGRLNVAPLRLPVPEVTRRVRGGAEVVAVGDRERGKPHAVHDVDDAEHVFAGPVLPVHADDERPVPAREVPRGQRPERAGHGNVLNRDAKRRFYVAEEVGPAEGRELPHPRSRPGSHRQRTRYHAAGRRYRGAEIPGAPRPGDAVELRPGQGRLVADGEQPGVPGSQADEPHVIAGGHGRSGLGRQGLEPDLPGQAPAAAGQSGYRETACWEQSAWHENHYPWPAAGGQPEPRVIAPSPFLVETAGLTWR